MNPYMTANKSKLPGIRSVAYCCMAMGNGDGMLLTSVTAKREGSDYYGRPGYPLSHRGGTGQYVWNSAGLLKADSARQIKIIHYTPLSLPKQINFNDGSCLDYKYRADGTLHQLITYSLIPGTRRLK